MYGLYSQGAAGSEQTATLVIYLDLSDLGLEARDVAEGAADREPRLKVLIGDNAGDTQACIDARAALADSAEAMNERQQQDEPRTPLPPPVTDKLRRITPDVPESLEIGAPPSSHPAAEQQSLPKTVPVPPSRDVAGDCAGETPPLVGRRAVAVIVDPKRQIDVGTRSLADAKDVAAVLGLAAGLSKEWP